MYVVMLYVQIAYAHAHLLHTAISERVFIASNDKNGRGHLQTSGLESRNRPRAREPSAPG